MKLRILSITLFAGALAWLASHTSTLSTDGTSRLMFGLWKTRELAIAGALTWLALAVACASVSKRATLRFVLANFTFALTWGLLEVVGIAGFVDYRALLNPVAEGKLGTQVMPHADVRGETREDLASAWGHPSPKLPFHFVTDRRGFRNEPDRAEADVYVLGDSFLVAGLVPWNETLTAGLEQRFDRSVAAFALNGLAPQEEIELFREAQLPLAGKLVLQFLFEGNDLLDSASMGAPTMESEVSLRDRTLANNLILKLQQWTQPTDQFLAPRSGELNGQTVLFRWDRSAFKEYGLEAEAISSALHSFREEVEQAGGTYAVVMIPSKIRILGPYCGLPKESPLADWRAHCSPWPEHVQSWCESQKIAYLDLAPALDSAMKRGDTPWFAGDTHWNALGNQVAADAVAQWSFVTDWLRARNEEQP